MPLILVDTGPLVAILAPRDKDHTTCVEILKRLRPPLVTCWPVLTEVAYLLRQNPAAIQSLFRMLGGGLLMLPPFDVTAVEYLSTFFAKYEDQEPQLADVGLMDLAERDGLDTIFTLDHRDFSLYRTTDGRALRLLPEHLSS